MRSTPSPVRAAGVLTAALAVAVGLSSCSLGAIDGGHEWRTADDMAASRDSIAVPSLVERDATDIRLQTPPFGEGPPLLSWHSSRGVVRDDCEAGPLRDAAPDEVPSWWPGSVPADGWRCGWWRVFEQDGGYFAWRHEDPSGK